MELYRRFFIALLFLCVVADVEVFLNSLWTGSRNTMETKNGLLLPGAGAWVSIAAKTAAKAAKYFSKQVAKQEKKAKRGKR